MGECHETGAKRADNIYTASNTHPNRIKLVLFDNI